MENKCNKCKNETNNQINIRLSEDDGFCSSGYSINLCNKCLQEIFINSYGFEFLKYKENLYIKHPINGCFELMTSKQDIDDAFDPEKAEFYRWYKTT